MSQPTVSPKKPLVVVLGAPKFVGEEYLEEFKRDFDYAVSIVSLILLPSHPFTLIFPSSHLPSHLPTPNIPHHPLTQPQVLDVQTHAQALQALPLLIASHGPISAFVIRMGRGPYHPFNPALLTPLTPSCRIIASAAAGYDDFDVPWLTSHNIWFCNSLNAVATATADMALFLLLSVIRDASRAERCARTGLWKDPVVPSRDPAGMTLGIVGMGAIGKHLARRAAALDMRIKYHNRRRLSPEQETKAGDAVYCADLHELLSQSDVVSINCPLTKETTKLISAPEFTAMKDGAFFVNTARGDIVDEPALIAALESGKVARAGLDVFWNEPDINDYFKTSDKVTIQPHVGGLTDLAFQKGERECFENIKALFKTGRPLSPVNEIPP